MPDRIYLISGDTGEEFRTICACASAEDARRIAARVKASSPGEYERYFIEGLTVLTDAGLGDLWSMERGFCEAVCLGPDYRGVCEDGPVVGEGWVYAPSKEQCESIAEDKWPEVLSAQ